MRGQHENSQERTRHRSQEGTEGQSGKASQRKLPEELLKLEIHKTGSSSPASRFCHFLVVWLWASYLTSLIFKFLLCEMRLVITALQGCCEISAWNPDGVQ